MMRMKEITYEQIAPYTSDYRIILHHPSCGLKYYALVNQENEICAVCDVKTYIKSIKIDCCFVPQSKRGNHYLYQLIMHVLFENQDKDAFAQANDWSYKSFLRAGFVVTKTIKIPLWTRIFMRRPAKNGKTKNIDR